MKKIMFYCQNLMGMGHLVVSTEIIRSLVKDFKVCLIDGGQIVEGFEIPPSVEVIDLPAVRLEQKKLKIMDDSRSLEEVKEIRKHKLITVFEEFQPDCLVTECFPFSKHQLLFELIPLLDYVQSAGRSTKVVCCLRDIINAKKEAKNEKICRLINQYFHLLLINSDPKFQRLEESFPRVKDLKCEIKYTGYVVQSPPEKLEFNDEDITSLNEEKPMILVSIGGGRKQHKLLDAVVESCSILEKYLPHHIQVFTGPFIPEKKFLQLQNAARDKANISIRKYTPHLLAYMEKADLSISLGGYNTTMNILRTGVRAMILPSIPSRKKLEQLIRVEKLEKLGIVDIIRPHELNPANLTQKIIACLKKEPVAEISNFFDLQGAQKTAALLQQFLERQVVAA